MVRVGYFVAMLLLTDDILRPPRGGSIVELEQIFDWDVLSLGTNSSVLRTLICLDGHLISLIEL